MATLEPRSVRDYWQKRASDLGLSEVEVTHPDIWQRWLEIETIKKFVKRTDRVLDVGCGNGCTSKEIATHAREVVGIDYSEEMIARAAWVDRANSGQKSTVPIYRVVDVLDLGPEKIGLFDVVLSVRCLINLQSWADQKRAMANIASVLKPGGLFLFMEGSKGGREELNKVRVEAGLTPMPPVWYNNDFEEERTLQYLGELFTVEERLHFGVYDFISRVVHPLSCAPDPPCYDSKINELAARLALNMQKSGQEFGAVSRVLFLALRRPERPV